jgi:hypothetical protein
MEFHGIPCFMEFHQPHYSIEFLGIPLNFPWNSMGKNEKKIVKCL